MRAKKAPRERALDVYTCAAIIQAVEGRVVANLSELLLRHNEDERTLFLRADQTLPAPEARGLLRTMQNTCLTEI
jgi:hypothetical protein